MKLDRIVTGYLEENCYIIKDEKNKECLIVDPGDDFPLIDSHIGKYKVLKVLITHRHFDHVGALNDIISKYDVLVLDKNNAREEKYKIGNFSFSIIFTPGHSSDSISFYFEKDKIMFTGDFLFKGSIGRSDLPTGSDIDMRKSIKLIKDYPEDIIIYPGHGDMSNLKDEFLNNFFLK